jgi:hypothetical protein
METDRTIAMDGAAWLASSVASFATRSEFVKAELRGHAFAHQPQDVRAKMLEQVYNLAVPPKKGKLDTK